MMGSRLERWTIFAVLVLMAGAGIAVAATGRERSDAVYPPQKIPLNFSHQQHIEADVECEACHDKAHDSLKATDRLLPAHPECESCHDIEKAKQGKKVSPAASCNTCHAGFDETVQKDVPKAVFPTSNLIFNHSVHTETKKIECVVCHNSSVSGTMADVGLASRYQLPKMETCLTCHNGSKGGASAACATCHVTDGVGKLQLAFASGAMRPIQGDPFGIDHGPRYEFTHGTRALLERKLCMECHTEGMCMQCHDGLQKPLAIHPNDFITLHPLQARQDSTKCDSCHRFQSFCAACHERVGVGLNADSTFRPRNMKVHADWDDFANIPGPKHHGIIASRDIKQCLACHREESCTACHAKNDVVPGARGFNPHPDGFKDLCKGLAGKNDRACLKCHSNSDLMAKGCR